MSQGPLPNFSAWLCTAWGAGGEFWSATYCGPGVIGLSFGQNPPYMLDDFLAVCPKFFGLPLTYPNASTTQGSNSITFTGGQTTQGLRIGMFLQGAGLPAGTVITGVQSTSITVNNNATATGTGVALTVYTTPIVPIGIIQLYINLASNSLMQSLWCEQWPVAMFWFIAHYCTLYAQTDAQEMITALQNIIHGEVPTGTIPGTVYNLSQTPPGGVLQGLYKNGVFLRPNITGDVNSYTLVNAQITLSVSTSLGDKLYATWPTQQATQQAVPYTAAQIAVQAIANGIETSKSVGDVSASYSVLESLKDWGQWNLTKYGQQLATMAKVVGSGPLLVW